MSAPPIGGDPQHKQDIDFESQVRALLEIVKSGDNPFTHREGAAELLLSLSLFAIKWLEGQCIEDQLRDRLEAELCKTVLLPRVGVRTIALMGQVLQSADFLTSWLNTEKKRARHRILDCFGAVLRSSPPEETLDAVLTTLLQTVAAPDPAVTVDLRGQCGDLILELVDAAPTGAVGRHIAPLVQSVGSYAGCAQQPLWQHLTRNHDTIDPHVDYPDDQSLDLLEAAARRKAAERALVFSTRLARGLLERRAGAEFQLEQIVKRAEPAEAELRLLRDGVLHTKEFAGFIEARLPSHLSCVDDYVVNRDQVLHGNLTIHELCRWLVASPYNCSSARRARVAIACFVRQVFAFGHAANLGLDARPFFIDHGYSPSGHRLDWPSYVFVPAGVIWGKGAGVELSCGVAFGGGVDLEKRCGRDGIYIGGSWSATLYHGHSHVGGGSAMGAESRDEIIHYGLTVEDGKRIPWGQYLEAEEHVRGDVFDGVRTYRLAPRLSEAKGG